MQTSIKALILCVILCISLVTALQFGANFIPLDQIISALMSMIDPNAKASMTDTIITDIRLPRLIYSVLTGIGLSLVGLLMQTVTRNALADPYVLGVSSGASTGAVFAIIMGGIPLLGAYNTPVFAALGAALSIILVLLCVGKSNSPVKLILIGMGMTGIFSALTMMIIYGAKHEAQVRSAMFWLLGSFAGIQWGDLPLTAIVLTSLCKTWWMPIGALTEKRYLPRLLRSSDNARSASTTIFRPICVIALSIIPLFLMRLAVGTLHPITRAIPSIP